MKAMLLSVRHHLAMIGMGVTFGLIVLAALADSALAEKMDLGQIPKTVQEGWCKAHSGQYLDWGGAGTTCLTDAGGAMYCDKDNNCTGYPPKTPKSASRQQATSAFQGLGTGGKIMTRGIESEAGGMECVQVAKNAACFCSGKPECDLMKAKICDPKAQTCQTKDGVESCVCHVQE
jgi:hypothetical protein